MTGREREEGDSRGNGAGQHCSDGSRAGHVGRSSHAGNHSLQRCDVGRIAQQGFGVVLGNGNLVVEQRDGAAPLCVGYRQLGQVAEHIENHVAAGHAGIQRAYDVGNGFCLGGIGSAALDNVIDQGSGKLCAGQEVGVQRRELRLGGVHIDDLLRLHAGGIGVVQLVHVHNARRSAESDDEKLVSVFLLRNSHCHNFFLEE